MPKKALALVMLIAAFSAVVMAAYAMDDLDSASDNGFQCVDATAFDHRGFEPRPDHPPMFEREGAGMSVDHLSDKAPDQSKFGLDVPRNGPGMMQSPDFRGPGYQHDATPEDFERMIPVMVNEDISQFDAEFVKDAIDYAKDNEMSDVADILQKKLSDYLSILRLTNSINSVDTRATGLFEDEEDDSDDFYVEDEDEGDEDVPQYPSDPESVRYVFKPVSSPVQVNLQLDL